MSQIGDYGFLLNLDIKLHRMWFKQMCSMIGINVKYFSVKPGKDWTQRGEIDATYNAPIVIGCVFDEHPTQRTMKKSVGFQNYKMGIPLSMQPTIHPTSKQEIQYSFQVAQTVPKEDCLEQSNSPI